MPAITRALANDPPRPEAGKSKLRIFDSKHTNFFIESRASGVATFYVRLQQRGRQRDVKLGRVGVITLDQARKRAAELKAEVALGGDPVADRANLNAMPTFAEFVEESYLPFIKGRLRSFRDQESFYRLRLKGAWGRKFLDQIKPADVVTFQGELKQEGLSHATINRYTASIKRIYSLAGQWEVFTGRNPGQRAHMFREESRERFLTDTELVALFRALEVEPSRGAACAIAMLAATGARRSEVLGARWERVDVERRILTVPPASSKSGRARYIPLSDAALRILQRLPRTSSPWVFPSVVDPDKPIGDLRKAWARVKERAGIEDAFCLHSLRHTYASRLVGQGRSLYEVSQLLGHSTTNQTSRYAHLAPRRLVEAANLALPDVC